MSNEWYYQSMGERIGPVSSEELRNLAQRGTISTETPISNAPDGPWVASARVIMALSSQNGMRPATAVEATDQVPSHDAATQDESSGLGTATKVVLGVCGGICVLVLGFLVWFVAIRDNWEAYNAPRVMAKLEEANRLQQIDLLEALNTYDEIFEEVKQHKITDKLFAQKIAKAEQSRMVLYQKVQKKIQADEAEKQRLAQEEAERTAEGFRAPQRYYREQYYRDRHGAIVSETDTENKLMQLRSRISSMPDNLERAYLEGALRALEKEWDRIKRQGPSEP